jgi:tRNA threonylcarbamoyladenosine modification (KEOPS) complex  Pcc1 subunit
LINEIISNVIIIKTKDPKNLKKLLDLEFERKKYNRSESNITISKEGIKIEISAQDIIAFKATVNNYINILELIKKTYEVDL